MPLKPGRAGRILGADNRTLTDLYTLLGQINDKMTEIRTASSNTAYYSQLSAQHLQYIATLLNGSNAPGSVNGSTLPGMLHENRNAIVSLLTMLQLEAAARTGSYAALKQPGELPLDSSIFTLLRSIDINQARAADCCEGESPTGPPTNDRPSLETRCATDSVAVRVTSLVPYAEPSLDPDDMYMLDFSPIVGPSAGRFQNGTGNYPGGVTGLPIHVAQQAVSFCVDWNFVGDNTPAQMTIYRFTPTGLITSGTSQLVGNLTDDQGCTNVFPLLDGQAFAVAIRVLDGVTPPGLNMWVSWQDPE